MTIHPPEDARSGGEQRSDEAPTPEVFEGLDFANHRQREGRAFLIDDGKSLRVSFDPPAGLPVMGIGVDCPFGTSAAFVSLLSGVIPEGTVDPTFQSRSTEVWVRKEIGKPYGTCSSWDAAARAEHGRNYFHPTTHVQPAIAMRIVPNCLAWLIKRAAAGILPAEFLKSCRRGEGGIVEAHPRLFLYSMIERVHRVEPGSITSSILNSVAGYKNKNKVSHRERRKQVYEFLREHPGWTGTDARRLEPEEPDELLFVSDHAFDAWLSALTAWAQRHGECITWDETEVIPEEVVDIEVHILILRQKGRA